jgi:hypothetical protein
MSSAADYVARMAVLHIGTELRSGGEVVTPIWGVVVDGAPYIRSAYGAESHWYRRAQRTGRAALIDGDTRYPVEIENLDDEAMNREVDRAYEAKYAGEDNALREVVSAGVRRFTMRLKPLVRPA